MRSSTLRKIIGSLREPFRYDCSRELEAILAYVGEQGFDSIADKVDSVRSWIYEQCLKTTGVENRDWDVGKVIANLWDTHVNGTEHAAVSCGPRAETMQVILSKCGMESRVVSVFSGQGSEIVSHTLVEAYDSDLEQWVGHCPYHDLYYIDSTTERRLSVLEMVQHGVENATFVSPQQRNTGLNERKILEQLHTYFEAVLIHANKTNNRVAELFVDTDRFSLDRKFPESGNLTLGEFAKDRYGVIVKSIHDEAETENPD